MTTPRTHPLVAALLAVGLASTPAVAQLEVEGAQAGDALGFVSSSRCTGEENYLMQKLARAAFGTNNCHQCAAT